MTEYNGSLSDKIRMGIQILPIFLLPSLTQLSIRMGIQILPIFLLPSLTQLSTYYFQFEVRRIRLLKSENKKKNQDLDVNYCDIYRTYRVRATWHGPRPDTPTA